MPSTIFAAPGGDDRGVRDRDAERVAEERRHREPVGEAADDRRLESRGDDLQPRRDRSGGEGDATRGGARDRDAERNGADVVSLGGRRAAEG